jgi:hypothetical protein
MGSRRQIPASRGRGLGRDLAALALLLLLCALFFWPILTPNRADGGSFRAGDFYVQTYACSTYKARALLAGQIPLWNPYVYSGHPFLADLQNSTLYPPSLLTVLLSAPWGYSVVALEIEAIAHFFLAGATTYFLGRRLFGRRDVALLVGIIFMFGGYLTSYPALQLPILETAAWLPLILLLLDLAACRMGSQRAQGVLLCLLSGAVLGVALLAGHAQTAMYVSYLAVGWYLFRSWTSGGASWVARFGGLATLAVAAAGVAAIQLLPAVELMRLSIRASAAYHELSSGFAAKDLLQILQPGVAGYWSPLYIGTLPLVWVLFAWAVWLRGGQGRPGRRWRRDVAFWSGVAALALLLALGGESFLYSLFYLVVPGFGLFRSQERIALIWSLAMALLSGYGLQHFLHMAGTAVARRAAYRLFRRIVVTLLAGMAILILVLLLAWTYSGGEQAGALYGLLSVSLFASLLLAGGWAWGAIWRPPAAGDSRPPAAGDLSPSQRRSVVALALLVGLVTLDLFTLHADTNVQSRLPERQVRASPLIEELLAAQDAAPFRVHHGGWQLLGNYGCIFGIEDTWGASQMQTADYARFLGEVPAERAWEMLNVHYVVTWRSQLEVPSEVIYHTTTRQGDDVYLHHLEGEAPRAWGVLETRVVSIDEALALLSQADFDHYQVALLEAPLDTPLTGGPAGDTRVTVKAVEPERLVLEAEMPARGLVILSQRYYPGWRASVDGQPASVHRADAIFQGIEVPQGTHRLEIVFQPLTFYVGAGLSLLTVVAIIGYTVWVVRRTR